MSQSSQESINLLSPPPEPVTIARGVHGLLTVAEGVSNECEQESKTVRDSESRVGRGGKRDESESNQMLGSACKRISTEAAFASAKRRRRGPVARDEVESTADQASRESPARKEPITTANWRNYTKSYKSTKPTTSPEKDSPSSHPNHSSTNNVQTEANSPKEATIEAKRPSSEFRNTYLPLAPSRKSALDILNTSKDIETAMILNKEIVVPGEGGADASNQEEYIGLSQITMACTQAFVGCPVDEEDDAEGNSAHDDTHKEQDMLEYESSAKKQPQTEDGCEKFSVLSRVDLDSDHMAMDTPAGYRLGKVDEGETDVTNEQSSAHKKSDVFEFDEGDGRINLTKTKSKPLPPVAYAAAKKRKKGPTDKALLEEDYESSQRSKSLAQIENIDVFDAASGQSKEEQQNETHLDISIQKQTREETILKNYTSIEAMGKAMSCPICCHSFKSAKCLPCSHAFCHDCLNDALKTSLTCPICRKPCTRRSGNPMQQLDDIVNGYKEVSRAFGFAPVVHSKSVKMTQLSPENDCFDYEERENKIAGLKKKRLLGVNEALEHHQIAQSNHEAFASFQKLQAPPPPGAAAQKPSGNRMTREELEQLNLTRRYQLLANDQAAVMQADKDALEKAMKKKVMLAEATLEFAGIQNMDNKGDVLEESKDDQHENKKTVASTGDAEADMETRSKSLDAVSEENQKMSSAAARKESQDTFYTSNNQEAGKKDSAAIPLAIRPIESQDTFHTAKSEHTKETQPPRESVATAPSPTIIHDGNTVKRGRPEKLEADQIDNRQSLATVESTVIFHDGNTVEKKKAEADQTPRRSGKYLPLSADADDQKATEASSTDDNGDTNEDVEFEGLESPQSLIMSERNASRPLDETKLPSSSETREIVVGSIVLVQSRTWPGINKHGGVGRVIKVDSTGGSNKYDVSYVLGGKEKAVDELYISLNEAEQSDKNDITVGARVSRSAEKKPRPVRKRKIQKKKHEPSSSSSVPIYNDAELEHIPEDVLKWAGIKARSNASKKRVLADSKGNNAFPKKPKKPNASSKKTTLKSDGKDCDAVENMSVDQLVICADQRYSFLLEDATLYAVTSSLSDAETKQLSSLTKTLKGLGVTLKTMKDFKHNKTQLCITSATTDSSHKHNIIAKSRTLKIMRSALHGIPILTPHWMSECAEQKRIVPPTGAMCIRTLPRKMATEDDTDVLFGVAKCAAAVDRECKILGNCSVFLCGQWKSTGGQNTMKDLKVLLEDAGARIVKSLAVASKLLADNESSENLIFLCDDSHLDTDCGVPENLLKSGQESKVLTVVHFHWLFDCVSCAKMVSGEAYEPLAPRTKELWRLNCI